MKVAVFGAGTMGSGIAQVFAAWSWIPARCNMCGSRGEGFLRV